MRKKQLYEAPDAELFEIRFEENILSGETTTPFAEEDDDIFGN